MTAVGLLATVTGARPAAAAGEALEADFTRLVLARASARITDTTISADVAAVVGLRERFGRPLWEMTARDLDRYFGADQRSLAAGTKIRKAAGDFMNTALRKALAPALDGQPG